MSRYKTRINPSTADFDLVGGSTDGDVTIPEYFADPSSPSAQSAWVRKNSLGGLGEAYGLLLGLTIPGSLFYDLRYRTDEGTTISFVASGYSNTLNYLEVSAAYTLIASDYTVNCTSGTFTVTLPTAVGVTGQIYNIKNSGTGIITVATTSSQTIDGFASSTITLNQYDNLQIQSTGANWIIL